MIAAKTIKSENDVWSLLTEFATNKIDEKLCKFEFDNFPNIKLKFSGDGFSGAIPVRTMKALEYFQYEIYRIYKLANYNDETKQLSDKEKDKLEIFYKIESGSTEVIVESIKEIFNKILEQVDTMESKHKVIVLCVAALGITGYATTKLYLDHKSEIEQNITVQTLSSEETKRLKIIRDIVSQKPVAQKVLESTDSAIESIAKSVKESDQVIVNDGNPINEISAKEMYPRKSRRTFEETRLDGKYRVSEIIEDGLVFKLKLVDEGGTVFYPVQFGGDESLFEKINSSISGRVFIELKINAKEFEGEFKDMVIATEVPQKKVVKNND